MDDAHALNRELTALLRDAGEAAGFEVVAEYPLRGGRLDVVWGVPSPIPSVDRLLPVVGFEIESSWRTRKHVKGDLLNLQDAGVALGVIVLAGETDRDDALRRFAETLVNRPGPQVLVWTTDDVRALAAGQPPVSAEARASQPAPTVGPKRGSKYDALAEWLIASGTSEVRSTFEQIEEVLGFAMPPSARNHPAWWSGSVVARSIGSAGWRAAQVNLTAETVVFVQS